MERGKRRPAAEDRAGQQARKGVRKEEKQRAGDTARKRQQMKAMGQEQAGVARVGHTTEAKGSKIYKAKDAKNAIRRKNQSQRKKQQSQSKDRHGDDDNWIPWLTDWLTVIIIIPMFLIGGIGGGVVFVTKKSGYFDHELAPESYSVAQFGAQCFELGGTLRMQTLQQNNCDV